MQAVQGKVFYKPDRIFDRIKVMFTDALGQFFVRLKRMLALAPHLDFFQIPGSSAPLAEALRLHRVWLAGARNNARRT